MKSKPITPYQHLMERFHDFVIKCIHRETHCMWQYPFAKLNEPWRLKDLWERVSAAEQLGFNVQLKATEAGLDVVYIKKVPERPWGV